MCNRCLAREKPGYGLFFCRCCFCCRLFNVNNFRGEMVKSLTSVVVTSEDSADEGWNTEEIEIPDEDFATMDAKTLMDEAKAGNVEELHVPNKVNVHLKVLSCHQ